MLISADQILAHLVGDYILQSDWMASEKTRQSFAAAVHAFCYSLPFLLLLPSWQGYLFIAVTHFVIDRWRLARYVVWVKNFLAPRHVHPSSSHLEGNGYNPFRPEWLTTWLFIIADNTLHLICNGIALRWL